MLVRIESLIHTPVVSWNICPFTLMSVCVCMYVLANYNHVLALTHLVSQETHSIQLVTDWLCRQLPHSQVGGVYTYLHVGGLYVLMHTIL